MRSKAAALLALALLLGSRCYADDLSTAQIASFVKKCQKETVVYRRDLSMRLSMLKKSRTKSASTIKDIAELESTLRDISAGRLFAPALTPGSRAGAVARLDRDSTNVVDDAADGWRLHVTSGAGAGGAGGRTIVVRLESYNSPRAHQLPPLVQVVSIGDNTDENPTIVVPFDAAPIEHELPPGKWLVTRPAK